MKKIILITIAIISVSIMAGPGGGGGGPRLKSLMNSLNIESFILEFDKNQISNIQLSNGLFVSPSSAAITSKDADILKEKLFININSREIFDVQMKDGRTCVILDKNCY